MLSLPLQGGAVAQHIVVELSDLQLGHQLRLAGLRSPGAVVLMYVAEVLEPALSEVRVAGLRNAEKTDLIQDLSPCRCRQEEPSLRGVPEVANAGWPAG